MIFKYLQQNISWFLLIVNVFLYLSILPKPKYQQLSKHISDNKEKCYFLCPKQHFTFLSFIL